MIGFDLVRRISSNEVQQCERSAGVLPYRAKRQAPSVTTPYFELRRRSRLGWTQIHTGMGKTHSNQALTLKTQPRYRTRTFPWTISSAISSLEKDRTSLSPCLISSPPAPGGEGKMVGEGQ